MQALIQKLERNKKLLKAAEEGNVDLVTTLLEEGAEVEYKDEDGDTAAHEAAKGGHDAVLTILLDNGAMVNTRGRWDRTPIMYAAEKGHTTTIKLLHNGEQSLTYRTRMGGQH